MKCGLTQCLGPITQACHLAMGKEDKFNPKWEQAFMRTFNYLPEVETIARWLKASKPEDCKPP